jgi:hypothetical protein
MKNLLRILVLAAAVVAAQVQLQAQTVTIPSDGTWLTVAANTTSNLPVGTVSIDVSGQRNVAIEWTVALNGTDVTNVGCVFIPIPISGQRPSAVTTAYGMMMTRLSSGTSPICIVTNFDTLGFSRLDLLYVTNNSATMVLSNQFRYFVKKGI